MFWPKVVWSKCVTAAWVRSQFARLVVTRAFACDCRYGDTLADFKVRCGVTRAHHTRHAHGCLMRRSPRTSTTPLPA